MTPKMALGSRPQSIRREFSSRAFDVTATDPRIVPLMVWGLKNFQNACWKARRREKADGSGCWGVRDAAPPPPAAAAAVMVVGSVCLWKSVDVWLGMKECCRSNVAGEHLRDMRGCCGRCMVLCGTFPFTSLLYGREEGIISDCSSGCMFFSIVFYVGIVL